MRTLVLGGIRSGKSAVAENLLAERDTVRYVATAEIPATGDPDFVSRVDRHRARRPRSWTTVESGDVAGLLCAEPDTATLVDDLGNWLSRLLDAGGAWDNGDIDITTNILDLVSAVEVATDVVLVSPEVGLSLVAPTPAGRRFQDDLGRVNTAVAAVCDRVLLVVAGKVLDITVGSTSVPISGDSSHDGPAVDIPVTENMTTVTAEATGTSTAATSTVAESVDFPVPVAPSNERATAARDRQAKLTKPAGSLGRLEDIATWAASCQDNHSPAPFDAPAVVIFAGDHGVAKHGVSAYPPEVTAQMVATMIDGRAAVNVLAGRAGARVRLEDISVDSDTDPRISRFKVRRGSGDVRHEDALSAEETRHAIAAGRAIADEQVDSGTDLLIAGDMGIGNTTAAAILIGVLTSTEPVVVVGRGTGVDDEGWIRKTAAIRDGMRRGKPHRFDMAALLQTAAGADLAAMAGFLAQAAVRRTPVILDGVVVAAAALVANGLAPGARDWWLAGHRSAEPAHAIALSWLDLTPVLELGMRLGEGSGALTALPIVQAALATLASMTTFAEAGVSTVETPSATR